MAHIAGLTYVSSGRVFAMDEDGFNFQESADLQAITGPVSVGLITSKTFRVYVGTVDGNVTVFHGSQMSDPPQIFHVTDQPVLWSLAHADKVVYLGTQDPNSPGPFFLYALDDRTLAEKWRVLSPGGVWYPAVISYDGDVPKQVIFSSFNPNGAIRGIDVATGTELWNAPDFSLSGQTVHNGVVYYANASDSSLRARSAADGTLLWSFRHPNNANFLRPVVAGGVVWASSESSDLFSLRASDGAERWQVHVGAFTGTPVVHFDHGIGLSLLAVAEQNTISQGFLRAFDANTGAALWTSSAPVSGEGISCTDPIAIPGPQVQVGNQDGQLMTFRATDGQLKWQKQLTSLIAKPRFVVYI